jgi:hypothetical protein
MNSNTLFHTCWLRESSAGHLDTDLGSAVPASRLELALMGLSAPAPAVKGLEAAPNPAALNLESAHIHGALESLDRVQSLPKWLLWRLTSFFGPLNTEIRVREARRNMAILSATCDRIREAAGQQPWVELYLPYFGRREWNNRFELLSRMQFEQRHGCLQVVGADDPMSLHQIVLRVAAGVFHPTFDQGSPLRFVHEGPLQQPWGGALASRWGFTNLPQASNLTAIDIRVSCEALQGWRKSPRPHHGRHHAAWAKVAIAVQWIMRRWNVALHMSRPDGLEDVNGTIQALMFFCLRPWSENVRSELTYDILDESLLQQAFEKAAKRLVPCLNHVAAVLHAAGRIDLANEYLGLEDEDIHVHAARLAGRAMRGRAVRGMLAAETAILNGLMRYSQEVKNAESPRAIRLAAEALVTLFNEQMPRIFRGNSTLNVDSAIFLEATEALHVAVGGSPAMDVRIQAEDGCWYANSDTPEAEAA